MKAIFTTVTTILLLMLMGCSTMQKPSDNSLIEFRLAEKKPVNGFLKMANKRNGDTVYVSPIALFDNKDIESIALDKNQVGYVIKLQFNEQSKKRLLKVTQENRMKNLAVLVNKELITAPVIQSPIYNGDVMITGYYLKSEAEKLYKTLVD